MNEERIRTDATPEDLAAGKEDSSGVIYSADGRRLLRCRNRNSETYAAREGTRVVCDGAFSGCRSLVSVTLPGGVTAIGSRAFSGCDGLVSVILPGGVTEIGPYAFHGCTSLETLTLPEGLLAIREGAFRDCGLRRVKLPSTLNSVGDEAFEYCWQLTDAEFSRGLVSLGEGAFAACGRLTEAILPDSVEFIGASAFECCHSLSAVSLPAGLKSLKDEVFRRCEKLSAADLPPSLETIGRRAFWDCSSLRALVLPASLKEITSNPFTGCRKLKITSLSPEFAVENDLLVRGLRLVAGLGNRDGYNIPDYITVIGGHAFCRNYRLTDVHLPDSLVSIEDGAFFGCRRLAALELPPFLKEMEGNPFAGCRRLDYVKSDSPCFAVENDLIIRGSKVVAAIGNLERYVVPAWTGVRKEDGCPGVPAPPWPPARVKSIGAFAFYRPRNLRELELPPDLEEADLAAVYRPGKSVRVTVRCRPEDDREEMRAKFRRMISRRDVNIIEII